MDYRTERILEKEMRECISIEIVNTLEIIANELAPEDVFPEIDLGKWAEDNGYVKED